MPLNSLLIGPENNLVQNTVYALPARAVVIYPSVALEVAVDAAFTTGVGAISSTTSTLVSGGFVRCTTGAAIVYCKA